MPAFAQQMRHNPWLDLLRTVAIFLVLMRHGSRSAGNALSEGFVANLFKNGWVGVDLFFVLSGYLIATGLIRRSSVTGRMFPKGYFQDRILRIVPAYYAVLIVCAVGVFPGTAEASAQSLLAHLLFLQDYTGSNINVVLWSLGVEEKFYIIAPVVVVLMRRQSSMAAFVACCVALLLFSPLCRGLTFEAIGGGIDYGRFFEDMRSPFHMSLEGFVIGIAVAIGRDRGLTLPKGWALAGLSAGALVLVMWLGSHDFMGAITRVDAWLVPTVLALLFGAMVFCAACLGGCALRCEPFFRVNARLSYSLYLVHLPLLPLAYGLGAPPVSHGASPLEIPCGASLDRGDGLGRRAPHASGGYRDHQFRVCHRGPAVRCQRHGLCDLQPAVCVPFAAQAFECCGGMGLVALALCHADISSLASCQRCTCP
nr:acyltransferase [Novosphingobium sp.]